MRKKVYVEARRCNTCKELKGREHFSKDMLNRDGLRRQCKACASLSHRRWAVRQADNAPTEKQCRRCGIVKPREQFRRDMRHADGLRSYCTECNRIRGAADYALGSFRKSGTTGGPSLATWEQVGQAVEEIAGLQKIINHERSACLKIVQGIKTDLAAKITKLLIQQSHLEKLIERFIRGTRRNGERIERIFPCGRISFYRGRLEIVPNLPHLLYVVG
ncbi:MAG TPA: hypothetical protein VMW16_03610 [Sedimentisphaerales bacterium]|nr:hypothetical protein [Sedimentisphaerales bacterium]